VTRRSAGARTSRALPAALVLACVACAARERGAVVTPAPAASAQPGPVAPPPVVAAPPVQPSEPPAPSPAGDGEEAREAARAALLPRCGRCHDGRLPTAVPRALAVYDLSQPAWAASLTEARWRALLGRAERLPPDEREKVAAYARAELARLGATAP
jgi:hypothetical protein